MEIIKSDIVSLHGAAVSMIGGRPENQDDMAYLDTPLGFLMLVCDGMGGGPGGKTASAIVKQVMAEALCECNPQTPRDHALKMAAARANQALENTMKENPALNGMGSTFVAALINRQSAVVAHSGDSRCYRLRGKRCLYRSQDHSLVAELVSRKVLTEEDARKSPQANVITRGLGSTSNHVPEIDEMPYRKGDRFILCTDGVWGSMPHQELLKAFTQPKDIQPLLSDLSAQVDKIGFNKGGGHDNHTIAMFDMEVDSQMKESFPWKKWASISSFVVLAVGLVCCCLWAILNTKKPERHHVSHSSSSSSYTVSPSSGGAVFEHSARAGNPAPSKNTESEEDTDMGVHDHTGNPAANAETDMDGETGTDAAENRQIDEEAKKRLMEWMGRYDKDTDTVAKPTPKPHEKTVVTTPAETTQRIIDCYEAAKAVGGKTVKEALEKLDAIHKEIYRLFVTLGKQTKGSETHQTVEGIARVVDDPAAWYVDKDPDKDTKLYMLTPSAKKNVDKQIDRLKKLMKRLEEPEKKN